MKGAPGSDSLMSLSVLIRTCFLFRLLLRDGRQVRVGKEAASWGENGAEECGGGRWEWGWMGERLSSDVSKDFL